eukprot:1886096-Rhodomonas_salina.4
MMMPIMAIRTSDRSMRDPTAGSLPLGQFGLLVESDVWGLESLEFASVLGPVSTDRGREKELEQ